MKKSFLLAALLFSVNYVTAANFERHKAAMAALQKEQEARQEKLAKRTEELIREHRAAYEADFKRRDEEIRINHKKKCQEDYQNRLGRAMYHLTNDDLFRKYGPWYNRSKEQQEELRKEAIRRLAEKQK